MFQNIVLIGFMGSGKSSVGRHLADKTGFRFIDTDELIVQKAGKPITRIFAQEGEEYFRNLETEILESLQRTMGVVLATGGGIAQREVNHGLLKQIGPIVWLDADADTLFTRVSRNKRRPLLLTENPRETFDALFNIRKTIYENLCDIRIDSTLLDHNGTADAVLDALNK